MVRIGVEYGRKRMRELDFVRKNSSQMRFPYARSIDQHDKLREKNPRMRAS